MSHLDFSKLQSRYRRLWRNWSWKFDWRYCPPLPLMQILGGRRGGPEIRDRSIARSNLYFFKKEWSTFSADVEVVICLYCVKVGTTVKPKGVSWRLFQSHIFPVHCFMVYQFSPTHSSVVPSQSRRKIMPDSKEKWYAFLVSWNKAIGPSSLHCQWVARRGAELGAFVVCCAACPKL